MPSIYERAASLRNAVLWQSNASIEKIVAAFQAERQAAFSEAAESIRCDCCDVCGESPEYEHGACANTLADRIMALSDKEGRDG